MTLDQARQILATMNPQDAEYPLVEVVGKHINVRIPHAIAYELSPGESTEDALDKLFTGEAFTTHAGAASQMAKIRKAAPKPAAPEPTPEPVAAKKKG